MNALFHVIRVQECHFLFQHVRRDDYELCKSTTLFNSALQAIWNDAIVVGSHENHVVARLGISTLTNHQAFIGTVIGKDLSEIAVSVDLVKGAAKIARL